MENKPTLREHIAQSLLVFYGAGLNDGQTGLTRPSLVITDQLNIILNLLKEEVEGLTVIGDKEVTKLGNLMHGNYYSPYGIVQKTAQDQLSHTKEELKEMLGENNRG